MTTLESVVNWRVAQSVFRINGPFIFFIHNILMTTSSYSVNLQFSAGNKSEQGRQVLARVARCGICGSVLFQILLLRRAIYDIAKEVLFDYHWKAISYQLLSYLFFENFTPYFSYNTIYTEWPLSRTRSARDSATEAKSASPGVSPIVSVRLSCEFDVILLEWLIDTRHFFSYSPLGTSSTPIPPHKGQCWMRHVSSVNQNAWSKW